MKILYYSAHPHLSLDSPSGPGTHMREMINSFRAAGHEVEVLVFGPESNASKKKDSINSLGSKNLLKNICPKIIWETLKDLQLVKHDNKCAEILNEKIKEFKPQLIYERGYYLMTSGVKVAEKLNVDHILEMNAPFLYEKEYMTGQKGLMNKRARTKEMEQLNKTNLVLVVSSALKEYFITEYKIDEKKIVVTPNGVEPSKANVNVGDVIELRKKLGFREQDIIIGFVGSIFPYHGVDGLISAFAEVKKKKGALKLLIVGDGESLPMLSALTAQLGLVDSVIFTGNVSHNKVFNYISLMDIAVMARSNWYGSPVKIFEYGIMGKAIIAPDNKAVNDVMENGEDGILIRPDANELEAALQRMVNERSFRESVAKNFQQKVRENYTWKRIAENVLSVYSQIKNVG